MCCSKIQFGVLSCLLIFQHFSKITNATYFSIGCIIKFELVGYWLKEGQGITKYCLLVRNLQAPMTGVGMDKVR